MLGGSPEISKRRLKQTWLLVGFRFLSSGLSIDFRLAMTMTIPSYCERLCLTTDPSEAERLFGARRSAKLLRSLRQEHGYLI